jgi:hypothetical protein
VKLAPGDGSDVYTTFHTPNVVTRTPAVTSPSPSSPASLSFKVPFFYHLRAMRRRGELCKTPAIDPRRMEYTDSDTDSARLTGTDTDIYTPSLTSSKSDHVGAVYAI